MRGRGPGCRLATVTRRPSPGRRRKFREQLFLFRGRPGQQFREALEKVPRACRREPLRWRARACLASAWDRWTELPHRRWGTVRESPTAATCLRTATAQVTSGWWVTVTAMPARSSERGTGWAACGIRAASACRCRVQASRKAQASVPGPPTPRRPAREHPPPGTWSWRLLRRLLWCPEPERGTQRWMQEHLRIGLVPLRAPLLPCRAEDPHGNQSAFEFLRTSD
jgi:hypothetical protein